MELFKDNQRINTVDKWKSLAPPKGGDKQWIDNRSAKEAAKAWIEAQPGVPIEISKLFEGSEHFSKTEFEKAEPEYQIHFDSYRGPRNADLAIWAKDEHGPIGITVEAKADESFDVRVKEYCSAGLEERVKNPRSQRMYRITELSQALFFTRSPYTPKIGDLRYQLLTAAAGTIVHATEIGADRAVMIIQEFVTSATSRLKLAENRLDLQQFLARISGEAKFDLAEDILYGPFEYPGIPNYASQPHLFIGKVVRRLGEPSA